MDGDTIMYWWQGKRDGLFSRAPTALVLQKNHRVEGGELRGVFVSVSTFRRHGAAAGTFFDPGSPQNSGSAIDGNVHSVRVQVSIALHRYLPFAAEPAAAALRRVAESSLSSAWSFIVVFHVCRQTRRVPHRRQYFTEGVPRWRVLCSVLGDEFGEFD